MAKARGVTQRSDKRRERRKVSAIDLGMKRIERLVGRQKNTKMDKRKERGSEKNCASVEYCCSCKSDT